MHTGAELRAQTLSLEQWDSDYLDLLSEHCKVDRDNLKRLFEEERMMTPSEALSYGLIDEVTHETLHA